MVGGTIIQVSSPEELSHIERIAKTFNIEKVNPQRRNAPKTREEIHHEIVVRCKEGLAEHGAELVESHERARRLTPLISERGIDTCMMPLPEIRQQKNRTIFEYFTESKILTKPEARSYIANGKIGNAARNIKLNKKEEIKGTFLFYTTYAGDLRISPRAEAFNNRVEYRVLNHAAKLYGMRPFKNSHDFDREYNEGSTVDNLRNSNDINKELVENLGTSALNSHLTPSFVNFFGELFEKAEQECEGNLERLNDDQYNALTLSFHVFLLVMMNPMAARIALSTIGLKVPVALFNANPAYLNYEHEAMLFNEETGKFTRLGALCLELTFTLQELKDADSDERHANINGVLSVATELSTIARVIGEINDLNPDWGSLANADTKRFLDDERFPTDVRKVRDRVQETLGELPEELSKIISDVLKFFSDARELDADGLKQNRTIILKNIRQVAGHFSESVLDAINTNLSGIEEGISKIEALTKENNFLEVAEIAETAKKDKEDVLESLSKFLRTLHRNLEPLIELPAECNPAHCGEVAEQSELEMLRAQVADLTAKNLELEILLKKKEPLKTSA